MEHPLHWAAKAYLVQLPCVRCVRQGVGEDIARPRDSSFCNRFGVVLFPIIFFFFRSEGPNFQTLFFLNSLIHWPFFVFVWRWFWIWWMELCATLAGLGFGLAVGPFWSQWRLELACESNFFITSCVCGCDLLMLLGFRVPSLVLGCLKNWNQKVISFACACRYVPHVLGFYVPHFVCI